MDMYQKRKMRQEKKIIIKIAGLTKCQSTGKSRYMETPSQTIEK